MTSGRILLRLLLLAVLLVVTVPFLAAVRGAPAGGTSDVPPRVHNREATTFADGKRTAVRLDEREGDGVAWWPDLVMGDGTIEVDIRGKDVMQRSFVGVAFHGQDEKTYDAVYFRPFNFRADPPRNSRAVQYIAHPTHTWSKLREERPGVFEHAVLPVPDPTQWFHARVVVKFPDVRVYVNGSEEPSLQVSQLSVRKTGWVGVWVGNGSGGDFAGLKVVSPPLIPGHYPCDLSGLNRTGTARSPPYRRSHGSRLVSTPSSSRAGAHRPRLEERALVGGVTARASREAPDPSDETHSDALPQRPAPWARVSRP